MMSIRKLLAICIIVLSVAYQLCQKQSLSPQIKATPSEWSYFRPQLAAPQLHGYKLQFVRILLQVPILSNIITTIIYKQNDYSQLRDFGTALNVVPSYLPIRLATDDELKLHIESAAHNDYKSALQSTQSIEAILGKRIQASIGFLGIEEIHDAFKSNKITPTEFAQQSLSAAEALSALNGFIALNVSDVLHQAKASTDRWKTGNVLSILDGIPVVIKDEIDVKGYNTTHGTLFMSVLHGVATKDALIVSRLRELGAIIFGKSNMHEIGIDVSGINSHWKTVKNPYSKQLLHDSGGSSSGTAAIVAAGIVPIGVGSDGGGSIRIPASFQGLVGIKATFSRIAMHPDSWWSVVHVGFLTNNVRDAAICYLATAGPKKDESKKKYDTLNNVNVMNANPPIHLDGFTNDDLSDLRIGIYRRWFNDAQHEIVDSCTKMVNVLETKYNANIVDIKIPYVDMLSKAHIAIILAELTASESQYVQQSMPYHDSTLFTLLFGQKVIDSVDIMSAFKVRSFFMEYFENEIFDKVDMILLPSNAIVTPKYVQDALHSSISNVVQSSTIMRFATLGNFVGLPAFTVNVGYTDIDGNGDKSTDGSVFPVGLQLISDHWREDILFRLSNVIQKEVEVQLPTHNFKHNLRQK